jgi:hypothetical protein
MNTFHDLFRFPTRKIDGKFPPDDRRGEFFPQLVERSRKLHLWSPGQPTSQTGQRILIGIATWSGYDLALLDLIEDAFTAPIRIDVFDTTVCRTEADLEGYIPGLDSGPQTPFVGLWENGRLVETAAGSSGRQLVARVCSLEWAEVLDCMATVNSRP